jgi:hypothetical protein
MTILNKFDDVARFKPNIRDGSFSPQAPREPGSAGVNAPLPPDELVQLLGSRLVHCRVPHHPRPFAPRAFVGLGRVGGATDDSGEGVFPTLQSPGPAGFRPAWRRQARDGPWIVAMADQFPAVRAASNASANSFWVNGFAIRLKPTTLLGGSSAYPVASTIGSLGLIRRIRVARSRPFMAGIA